MVRPITDGGGSGGGGGENGSLPVQQIVAFGILGFALIVASDFPATGTIAVAFAYLILLGTLMAAGPVAFERLSNLVGK